MRPPGILSHWNIYMYVICMFLSDAFKCWEAMVAAVVVALVVTAVVMVVSVIADLY